jgi:CheY-like chemotaxis protein
MARTILVVDDEQTLREALVEALETEKRWPCSGPSGPTSCCST